jgi:diguanylate cyclase (GGDEF)-like protein
MPTYTTFVKPEELQRLHLFQGVQLKPLQEQLDSCSVRELEAGETLIARGQTNTYLYLLIAGRLRVYLDTMGETLSIIEVGESVGEISIIDKQPTTAHVVAETRCRLLVMSEAVLWSMVSSSHAVSINMLSLLASRLRASNTRLTESQKRERELKYKTLVDSLTGLYNRSWIDEELEDRLQVAEEIDKRYSLLMLDIDNFQQYNDEHGTLAGDRALYSLAQTLLNNLRPMDTAIRYGGEEFVAILPETEADTGLQVAEDLRLMMKDVDIRLADGKPLPHVTVSIGVAAQHQDDTPEDLIERAEAALKAAKDSGRNNVCVGESEAAG